MTAENKLALNLAALKETKLLFRESEIDQIVLGMKNGINTYVYGEIGLGKTTAVRLAMEDFNNSKNTSLYVNCMTCQTEYSILRQIIDEINSNSAQKIFIETRSNYDLIRRLKKEKERIPTLKIVVLDHIEALQEGKVVDSLLEIGFAIILVSDEQKAINKVSALSQSYFANTIEFKEYTSEHAFKILDSRAKGLLGEGNYYESLLRRIVEICHSNIAYSQSVLLAGVLHAKAHRKDSVDETDLPTFENKEPLGYDENLILEILKEKHGVQGGELYKIYCGRTRFPKAERTFRNYMRSLCEKNLVRAIGTNKGRVYELIE